MSDQSVTTSRESSAASLWWLYVLQGLFAVIFGVIVLVWPDVTLFVMTIMIGAYLMVHGVVSLVAGIAGEPKDEYRWFRIIGGGIGILLGIVVFTYPALSALTLLFLFAAWVFAIGILMIIEAFDSAHSASARWSYGLGGAVTVMFGIIFFAMKPAAGALAIAWLIGIQARRGGETSVGGRDVVGRWLGSLRSSAPTSQWMMMCIPGTSIATHCWPSSSISICGTRRWWSRTGVGSSGSPCRSPNPTGSPGC